MPGRQAAAKLIPVQPASRCETCAVRRLCLPVGLDQQDLRVMGRLVRDVGRLGAGDVLYRPGDPLRAVYAVKRGALKTYGLTSDGGEQITGFHLAGELVGLDAIDTHVHHCAAVALAPTELCELPFDGLEEICTQVPGLQREFTRIMSREIEQGGRMLLMIGRMSAAQRLACFLQNLFYRMQRLGHASPIFVLPMSREDIGNYLGMTLETVSRRFSALQRQGVIRVDRRRIEILDPAALAARCAQ